MKGYLAIISVVTICCILSQMFTDGKLASLIALGGLVTIGTYAQIQAWEEENGNTKV